MSSMTSSVSLYQSLRKTALMDATTGPSTCVIMSTQCRPRLMFFLRL